MAEGYESIEKKASHLLEQAGALAQPVDLGRVLNYLNLELETKTMESEYSGFLVVDKGVIVVNSRHAAVRRRFTVAHEIGHYHLHGKRKDASNVFIDRTVYFRDDTSTTDRESEMEANAYAARLLMPRALLKRYFEAHPSVDLSQLDDIKLLADEFRVSRDAMRYRLQNLGLILQTSF